MSGIVLLSLLHDPDRALRRSAMETLYRGVGEQSQVLSFIYDTLLQDHLTMDRLRLYSDPMAQRHLSNEIDATAVKIMMEVTEEHYGLAQDYFLSKLSSSSFRQSPSMINTRRWVRKRVPFTTHKHRN